MARSKLRLLRLRKRAGKRKTFNSRMKKATLRITPYPSQSVLSKRSLTTAEKAEVARFKELTVQRGKLQASVTKLQEIEDAA